MNKLIGIYELMEWQADGFYSLIYNVAISRTGAITFIYHDQKVTILFYGKFSLLPFIIGLKGDKIGLKGDNEKIKGWGNDVQRVEYEDSVDDERIYHNTPEYLSWKEMRNGEGFN